MDFVDITGLFSAVLFMVTLFSLLFSFKRLSRIRRYLLFVLFTILLLVPLNSVSVAAYVRGFIGDLSILTLVFLLLVLIGRVFECTPVNRKNTDFFCLLLFPSALVFYPLAMGLSKYDPYSIGYGSVYLLGSVFLVTLLAWAADQLLIVASVSLAVFCYAIGWYESNNLWDYLIDPFLAIYALGASINRYLIWGNPNFRRFINDAMNK